MQLRFKISVSGAGLTRKAGSIAARTVERARKRIVPLVMDRAQQVVSKRFRTMVPRYMHALGAPGAVDVTETGVTIKVDDPVVVALERGRAAFDMKARLLAHASKTSKKGVPYVDVPLDHAASSVPRGKREAASKALATTTSMRLPQKTAGKQFTRALQRGRVLQVLGFGPRQQSVSHKRGVHDDLLVSRAPGSRRNTYQTIRRVSAGSSRSAWWHPGFQAARILDGVLASIKHEVAVILGEAARSFK